ncbi:MAG: nickel pincer cofactor biosynthesis protein LarB, partial [Thermoplasmata archaeon]|nr:nickel pincer cofactor biosynthesis protein LarB [Thermoplasmata archaeon]
LAEGKTVDHLLRILRGLRARHRGALVSRPTAVQRRALERAAREGLPLTFVADGRIARLAGPIADGVRSGTVAVLSAGTADVPVAEEAVAVLRALGVRVVTSYDVGVAGIHRLQRALARLERRRPSAYLVFAGREGALPTVVAGLVRAPVVGIPTSIGYGRGGWGEAALSAMLQSCAPIAVVNIDAAVPAALFVAQLLAVAPRRRA